MGNGTSSQGGIPPHDKRDVGISVAKEQHDWQAEQAVAPEQETHSLQETRKPYNIIVVTCELTTPIGRSFSSSVLRCRLFSMVYQWLLSINRDR